MFTVTCKPGVATTVVVVITLVVEETVFNENLLEELVAGALNAEEATGEALECTVLELE